jgi:hypothetical protein
VDSAAAPFINMNRIRFFDIRGATFGNNFLNISGSSLMWSPPQSEHRVLHLFFYLPPPLRSNEGDV